MTAERATGLILRTRPLTETSLIVHWLTAEVGRVSTVAKGARRPKSSFRGKLDLFYLADFSFQRSRRSELHTLREVGLKSTHAGLREDYARLCQASYCALLVEQVSEVETPVPASFARLCELVGWLDRDRARPQYALAFELQLLHEHGLGPDLSATRLSPAARGLAAHLTVASVEEASRINPLPAVMAELRAFLGGFLVYHWERVPRGRGAAIGSLDVAGAPAAPGGRPSEPRPGPGAL